MARNTVVAARAELDGVEEIRLDAFENDIAFHLRRAQELSFRTFSKRVGSANLKVGDFAILSVLRDNPDINQMALSFATGRDKSTLTATLKRLEGQGFVERRRSLSDGRAYALHLTEAGKRHLAVLHEHATAHGRLLDRIVGEADKRRLVAMLGRIVSALEG